jgi:hypothetical protein
VHYLLCFRVVTIYKSYRLILTVNNFMFLNTGHNAFRINCSRSACFFMKYFIRCKVLTRQFFRKIALVFALCPERSASRESQRKRQKCKEPSQRHCSYLWCRRWAGHVARMGEGRNLYRVLVRKPEGRRPLGRPRRIWEDGIKMDLRESGWGGVEWIHLAQDRDRWRAVVNAVMNLRVLAPRS